MWCMPEKRPDWMVDIPGKSAEYYYFVGFSQKFAEEPDARKNAEQNAREQISGFISTEVSTQFQKITTTFGLSSEVFDPTAAAREFNQQTTDSVVKFAHADKWYIEQWSGKLEDIYHLARCLVSVPEQSILDALKMQEEKMKALALKQADDYLSKQIDEADKQIENSKVFFGNAKYDDAITLLSKAESNLRFNEAAHSKCHAGCDMVANLIPNRLGKIKETIALIMFEYAHKSDHQILKNEFETACAKFEVRSRNPNEDQMRLESDINAFCDSARGKVQGHRDNFKHCKEGCGDDLGKLVEAAQALVVPSLEKAVMNLVAQTFSALTGGRKVVFTSLMLDENGEEKNKINPKLQQAFEEMTSDSARKKFGDKVSFFDRGMLGVEVPSRKDLPKLTPDKLKGADAILFASAYKMSNDDIKLVMKLLAAGTGEQLGSGTFTINKRALSLPLEVGNSELLQKIEKEFSDIIPTKNDFKIEIWSDRGDDATYYEGEEVTFNIRSEKDGYVYLFHCDSEGNASLLFPSAKGDDNRVKAGKVCAIPPPSWGFKLEAGEPFGAEYLIAVASQNKIDDLEKLAKSSKGNFHSIGKIGQDNYSSKDWGTRGFPTKIRGGVAKLIVRTQKEK